MENIGEHLMLVDRILSEISNPVSSPITESVFEKLAGCERFAVWGTGSAAKYAIELCVGRGLNPCCVCDSFEHKPGELFCGFELLSEKVFYEKYPSCLVLVCCISDYGIEKKITAKGYSAVSWETQLIDNFLNDLSMDILIKDNRDSIEQVYELLSDERSKLTFENILRYRLTLDKKLLQSVFEPHYYFKNDVIPSVNCDAFIDCGAYYGDTMLDFFDGPECNCKTYYALEPENDVCERLRSNVELKGLRNVKIVQIAAWNEKSTLRFKSTGVGTGVISDNGNDIICADKLDNIVETKDNTGFIKMDIEGSEIEALEGAKQIITRDKPVLAISIYHKKRHLWEIPLFIHRMVPEYKLFIRHHTLNASDTMCYAIIQ